METNEVELIQHVSADVIYQQDKAFIDLQISTAKAFRVTLSARPITLSLS